MYRLFLILVYFGTTKFVNQRGNISNSRLDGSTKYTIKVVITSDILQQRINVRGEVSGWNYRVHDLCTVMYKIREHYSRDCYPYGNRYQQDYVSIIHAVLVLHYGNESWNTLQVIFVTMYYYQPSCYFLSQKRPSYLKGNCCLYYKSAVLTH